MNRPISAVRNTCFAILSAIECDVREELLAYAAKAGNEDLMPDDVRQAAIPRFVQDNKERSSLGPESDVDLLNYTDFGDLAKMLNRQAKELSIETRCDINLLAHEIEKMSPARNRVCHSRPMEEEDLPSFFDLSKLLLTGFNKMPWTELRRTQEARDRDPTYVLRLEIPSFWRAGSEGIHHNLHLPDYDETSFLGRVNERRELKKQLLGSHPVISVVGEGGVGKSALAVECCYELLDAGESAKFDAIVWVSLKTRALTAGGVREIRNAITDTLGVIETAAQALGAEIDKAENIESLTRQLLEYMERFRVLLVIDNFETLDTNALRPVLSAVPVGSKVLITSRVGIGELEIRYKLDAMDAKTAVSLIRRAARCLNLEILSSAPDKKLITYASLLYKNPLLIKWFVQSVASGADPERLVGKESKDFHVALRFCFENLFSRLLESERQILHVLASARRGLTQTELLYLLRQVSDFDETAVEHALLTLHNSSMLRRTVPDPRGTDPTSQIVLTDVASEYLARLAPPERLLFDRVQIALKLLREIAEKSSSWQETYKYDLHSICAGTRDQRIAAFYLKQAIDFVKIGKSDLARQSVKKAKDLLPNFSEAYRISALIETKAGDYYKVIDELEAATSYDPESALSHYQYGLFLQKEMNDTSRALEHFEKVMELDPKSTAPKTQKALAITRLGRCKEAAAIYEELLGCMDEWARKWRISTRHQAAECYRRLAEQDEQMRDDNLVKRHVDRACRIIEEAWGAKDSDERMSALYAEVIEDAIHYSMRRVDETYAVECMERISDASSVAKIAAFKYLAFDKLERCFGKNTAPVIRATQLSESIGWAEERSDSGRTPTAKHGQGMIKALPPNVSYGFITDLEGRDWFFHNSAIIGERNLNAWRVGQSVRFKEDGDEKGRRFASRVESIE